MDDRRCSECGGELTYCGDMDFDGPTLDCKVCRLRELVRSLRAEQQELEQLCGNLLAVIHGDGGHYIDEHGWEQAINDAIDKYNLLRSRMNDQAPF